VPNDPEAGHKSPLFGFCSLQRIPTEPASSPEAASRRIIPLQRFGSVPAVFSATPLRKRLTSFTLATVDQFRSCVTGLFLGGVPLSAFDGFGLVDPFLSRIDNALGISINPSQLYSCVHRVKPGHPRASDPACRSMNVRPDLFLSGDQSIQTCK